MQLQKRGKGYLVALFFYVGIRVYTQYNYTILLQPDFINPAEGRIAPFDTTDQYVEGKTLRIIQFFHLPTREEKQWLNTQGIELLDYLPHYAYYAMVDSSVPLKTFSNIRCVLRPEPFHKISKAVRDKFIPAWAEGRQNKVTIQIHFVKPLSDPLLYPATIGEVFYACKTGRTVYTIVEPSDIADLALHPLVQFIDYVPAEPQPEDITGKTNHRSNYLDTEYSISNFQYVGNGIGIILNDDGIIGPHIDYQGRIVVQYPSFNGGNHGDHVAGILMGAGNLDPVARGMAPGASLLVYNVTNYPAFDSIYSQYNWTTPLVRITSTSYSDGCNAGYTPLAQKVDQQIRLMPELMHVFSAGNNGNSNCGYGAGAGWGNITGGHKQGKNVIAVANLSSVDVLATSSSRGPAHDGRIKPDIAAVGINVYSTIDTNAYAYFSGTSMSCPAISGILAQLYEYYNSNYVNKGPSALMKAVLLNGADDLGNPGPDYKFGWGRVNVRRSIDMLMNGQYLMDTIDHGQQNQHILVVPPGVVRLKVMLYWHDYEGTVNTLKALVNDLDLTIEDPAAQIHYPMVLDPTPNPTNLNANAMPGVDTLNNMEQIVIDMPSAGTYHINVNGTMVPQGPQGYCVVWEFIYDDITVIYPNGYEGIAAGTTEIIRWDAHSTTSSFVVEYSEDNGITWNIIASSIPPTQRYCLWNVPSIVSSQSKIRVSNGNVWDESDTSFTIIGVPTNLLVEWRCLDSMKITWDTVAGAGGYEIRILGTKYMDSVAFSTQNSVILPVSSVAQGYWITVNALTPNDYTRGRRAWAIYSPPGLYNCSLPYDIRIDSVIGVQEVISTSCNNIILTPTLWVTNAGQNSITQFQVYVYKNAVLDYIATVNQVLIPGQSFGYVINGLSSNTATGTYHYTFEVKTSNDANGYNDTLSLTHIVYGLPVVNTPLTNDFEMEGLCPTWADCGSTECPLIGLWTNSVNAIADDVDWRVNAGTTVSPNTGPSTDYNPGTPEGQYVYLEASNCYGKKAILLSPCIDLSAYVSPVLTFAYHMYGANMGTLHVDVGTNGQWFYDIVPPFSDNVDQWQIKTVPLSSFSPSTITLAIRGVTGNGYAGDMAIDDIHIEEGTGAEEKEDLRFCYAYPIPVEEVLNIFSLQEDIRHLVLIDCAGKVIKEAEGQNKRTTQLDMVKIPAGVYILKVFTDKGERILKVVKM